MTTNELIAIGFPVLTAVAVGATGLFVRAYWGRKPRPRLRATGP
jgi:hypothetical protein